MGHPFAYDLPAVRFARILFATPLLAARIAFAGTPWIVAGRVVGISDGDTITVLDARKVQHKIRLDGDRRAGKGSGVRRAITPEPCSDGARKGCPDRV